MIYPLKNIKFAYRCRFNQNIILVCVCESIWHIYCNKSNGPNLESCTRMIGCIVISYTIVSWVMVSIDMPFVSMFSVPDLESMFLVYTGLDSASDWLLASSAKIIYALDIIDGMKFITSTPPCQQQKIGYDGNEENEKDEEDYKKHCYFHDHCH